MDLVEVAPTAAPPVCRIMDYGKYKYEQNKKDHVARQHQKGAQLKEIKLRPATGAHDLEFKINHARDFLKAGNRVKMSMMFRGREMAFQQRGHEGMAQILKQVQDVAQVEVPPRMEGRCLAMFLVPKAGKS